MVSIEMEGGKWVSATPRKTPRKLELANLVLKSETRDETLKHPKNEKH
jgi:hypothetical protein